MIRGCDVRTGQVSAFLETFESIAEVYLARDEEASHRSTRQVGLINFEQCGLGIRS